MTFENRSMSTRLMGLSRICKPLLRLNLVFFVCILFAGPRGFAQAPDDDQTSNPSVPSNPSSPSQRSQPQSDDEGTDQGANQQAGQSSTGGDQSVQMGVSPAQPTDALQSGGTMSPAQIISILQAEPDVLENVRSLVAQQTGADPTTITDFIYPDIYFSNNSAPLSTTLGADTTVRSLNFTSGATGSVTIGAGNTLTIGSVDSSVTSGTTFTLMNSGGITVQAGSGAHTVAANIVLGADQSWGNVSSNPLTVSGNVSGSHNLSFVGSYTIYNPGTYTADGTNYTDATFTTTSATASGTGGFVLSGSNSYTGATTLGSGAIVLVSGSLSGTASVSVASNASLSVNGMINPGATLSLSGTLRGTGSVGAVVAASGATVAPGGTSTGILSASSLNLQSGAQFSMRLGGTTAGTGYDQLAVSGGLTLAGALQGSLINGFGSSIRLGNEFFLTAGATSTSGSFSNVAAATGLALADGANGQINFGGVEFGVFYDASGTAMTLNGGSDVALLDVVPEPGTWQLLLGGMAVTVGIMRIRKPNHSTASARRRYGDDRNA